MAKEFPLVEFRGLDLGACCSDPRWDEIDDFVGHSPCLDTLSFHPTVPIQTRYPPQNVRFEIADVTGVLRFPDGSVDVVHARMTCLGVRSSYLPTCYSVVTWAL